MKVIRGQQGKRCDEAEYLTFTHKHCSRCDQVKAVSLFYRKKTKTARGWAWDTYCIDCRRAMCRDYGQATKEARNARLRKWRRNNPKAAAAGDRRARLKAKYGLAEADLDEMRESQDSRCAICERRTSRLFVDHCHTTGQVRALLCQTCNTFLGWYEKKADTILKFQAYIEQHA